MKKIVVLLSVLIFAASINAQSLKPVMSFEKTIHDFGSVKEDGGSVSFEFKFKNTGSQPLVIHNVRASCGCTSPEWSKMPIPPGGDGVVKAIFNPVNRPGNFNKTITVSSNAEMESIVLRITGSVTPKARTIEDDYPREMGAIRLKSSHLSFTKVAPKEKKRSTLEIINTSTDNVTIALDQIPSHISMKIEDENNGNEISVLKPNQKAKIVAVYDAALKNEWGFVTDKVYLVLDGKKDYNNRISLSATIEDDFSKMTPEELAKAPVVKFDNTVFEFGEVKQGDKVSHKYVLANAGKSDLEIRKVKASCGCTAVSPGKTVLKAGESTEIVAEFNSAGKHGRQNKSITVITNDPKSVSTLLRITGNVIE